MGLIEASIQDGLRERPAVRAKALESLRTALDIPHAAQSARGQPAGGEMQQPGADKKRDIAVAMGLAREAVATAAKAAEDELRHMRELLDAAEARVRAAEERAQMAEVRTHMAEARTAESEKLLADIRDQIMAQVVHRHAA
jgi:hypothetical protein